MELLFTSYETTVLFTDHLVYYLIYSGIELHIVFKISNLFYLGGEYEQNASILWLQCQIILVLVPEQ